jgi:hypothetical protein
MATTTVARGPSTKLHVRGTWSAREDRVPSAAWLGLLWLGMIAGFGVDLSRFAHENPPAPKILYVHAAVFTAWMLLLTAQVLLVLRDRINWHRTLGWFMAGWACLMGVLGPWAAMASDAANLSTPGNALEPQFLSVNIVDIVGFLLLLAWGIALRKNPAAHKRMMILATISLADPGYSRFSGWLWPTEPTSITVWFFYTFYGNVLLIVLMAAWDWARGRLIRSFVIGAAATLAAEVAATVLYFWGPWKALTLGWVQAWARHFG